LKFLADFANKFDGKAAHDFARNTHCFKCSASREFFSNASNINKASGGFDQGVGNLKSGKGTSSGVEVLKPKGSKVEKTGSKTKGPMPEADRLKRAGITDVRKVNRQDEAARVMKLRFDKVKESMQETEKAWKEAKLNYEVVRLTRVEDMTEAEVSNVILSRSPEERVGTALMDIA